MKAFIIGDNVNERDLYTVVLRHVGIEVVVSADLNKVVENWYKSWGNLVVLASHQSELVVEQVKQLRWMTQVPICIIVDQTTEAMLCDLLTNGADLVLERPVSPRILCSYAQALLRRTEAVPTFVLPPLELENLRLDPETRTVTVEGHPSRRLTNLEFNLLYVLMTNPEQVIPTDMIVERVWGYSGRGDRELVRGLVSRLRNKLEPTSKKSHFIQTIPGVGYRFHPDSDD